MLLDGREVQDGTVIDGDICIIGAGAAGLTIAREFLAANHQVILIESGGLEIDGDTQALYDGEDEEAGLGNVRTRYFGGSTNCWHGRCAPLDRIDFAARDWVPHSGWPFNRDALVPFYERAADLLRIGPFTRFSSDRWDQELFPGQYFSPFRSKDSRITGVPFVQSVEPDLRLGPRLKKPLEMAANFRVFLHSNLIALNLAADGTGVSDASARTLTGRNFKIRATRFVLALGGLENPRMLLSSNNVEAAGVGNRHDQVGRYFMGHSFTNMGQILYSSDDFCFPKESIGAPRGQLFFKVRDEIQRQENLLNAGFWLWRDISEGELAFRYVRQDIQSKRFPDRLGARLLAMTEDLGGVAGTAACNVQGKRKRADEWKFFVQAEMPPNRDNRVQLGRQTDALGVRRLTAQRRMSDLGRRTVLKATEIFGAEVTRLGMGRVKLSDDYRKTRLFSDEVRSDLELGHDIGTTRMASDARNGVVDSNCRVHGIENLFIGGSSVFPTSGFANPTFTIVALAMRIADRLKADLE